MPWFKGARAHTQAPRLRLWEESLLVWQTYSCQAQSLGLTFMISAHWFTTRNMNVEFMNSVERTLVIHIPGQCFRPHGPISWMVTEAEKESSFPDVEVNGIQSAIHLMDFHGYIDLAIGRWSSCLDTNCLYGSCFIDSMTSLFCIWLNNPPPHFWKVNALKLSQILLTWIQFFLFKVHHDYVSDLIHSNV